MDILRPRASGNFGAVVFHFHCAGNTAYASGCVIDKYQYDLTQSQTKHLDFKGQSAEGEFSYKSFDGSLVHGRIQYPEQGLGKYPVLICLHAMGRSYPRWFTASLKGRPTVTQVDKISALANADGFAVVAIDARYHGLKKILKKLSVRS